MDETKGATELTKLVLTALESAYCREVEKNQDKDFCWQIAELKRIIMSEKLDVKLVSREY